MTKAEELKLLAQIDALIKSADPGDYIPMTFAGMVEVCKRNIEDDFGNIPVQDAEDARNLLHAEECRHDETKRQLAEAQKIAKEALDENERNGKTLLKLEHENQALQTHLDEATEELTMWKNKWSDTEEALRKCKDERDVITECHDGLAEMVDRYEQEIMRLKAEVYDLRKWGESPVVPEGAK